MSIYNWFLNSPSRIEAALSIVCLFLIVGIGSVGAVTSQDTANAPLMYLYTPITSTTQTTGIVIESPQHNGDDWVFSTTTGGVLRISSGTYWEDIYYSSATVSATTNRVTLVGVVRDLCPATLTFVTCGNGRRWGRGAFVELTQDSRLFNLKANLDRVNTFGTGAALRGTSTTIPLFRLNPVTTAQRLAMSAGEGDLVYDSTMTSNFQYVGGAWTEIGDTGTVNATESAAGKIELATVAEQISASATGSTSAPLVVQAKYLVRSGSGSDYAGRIPILGNDGTLTGSLLPATAGDFLLYGDGSDGDVTVSTDTTLTRDMFYDNLTMSGNAVISMAGYRVFVKGTYSGSGTLSALSGGNGGNGGNANLMTAGTAGTGGAATASGSLPQSLYGVVGVVGATGRSDLGNGDPGTTGVTPPVQTNSLSVNGYGSGSTANIAGAGGTCAGGQTPGTGGTLGVRGTITSHGHYVMAFYVQFSSFIGARISQIRGMGGSAGAPSGGAGGNCSTSADAGGGGGSGGTGANGGYFFVAIKTIAGNLAIKSLGGNGGNGGNGGAAAGSGVDNAGGGGGGAGGNGGTGGSGVLAYTNITGTIINYLFGGTAGTGGTGGAGAGTGGGTGATGSSGNSGATGNLFTIVLQ